jgi:hypothetical protein
MSTDAPTGDKERVFLEADDEIRGQKYVCLSFLTPDRGILRNKSLYFFNKFLEFYAMDYKIRSTESFVLDELRTVQNALSDVELSLANLGQELSRDASGNLVDASGSILDPLAHARGFAEKISEARGRISQQVGTDLEAHVKANLADFKESSIVESYERWMVVHRQRLEDEFHKENNFQTSMHGLKVRGVYSTMEQATARAKTLNKKDPYFNVYVAEVGEWLPWDPSPDEVTDSSYQNDDLNKLMQAYKENAAKRDAFFEEEKRQKLAAAQTAAAAVKGSMTELNQRRGGVPKPTFGPQGAEQPAEETARQIFQDGPADLAIARRQEAANDTIELA